MDQNVDMHRLIRCARHWRETAGRGSFLHDRGWVTSNTGTAQRFRADALWPETGGTFYNGSNLPGALGGSANHQRRWDSAAGRPVDEDAEDDWFQSVGNSWGAPPQP